MAAPANTEPTDTDHSRPISPASKNYYEILQVPRGASDAQIKRAYRKLALQFHPVRREGEEGE